MLTLCIFVFLSSIHQSLSWLASHQLHHRNGATNSVLWSSFDGMEIPDFNDDDIFGVYEEEGRLSDEELESYLGDWDDRVPRMNTLHLVGRVGNSPEPRYFDDGKVVVNLSLACRRKYHYAERQAMDIKSGEEETDWYGLEIWGQTAEFVSKYVEKGTRVGVVGTLQIDEWNDRESGEKRNKAKVVVREFDILESRAEADLRRQNSRGPSFYTRDDDQYDPSRGNAGGFFD